MVRGHFSSEWRMKFRQQPRKLGLSELRIAECKAATNKPLNDLMVAAPDEIERTQSHGGLDGCELRKVVLILRKGELSCHQKAVAQSG